MTLGWPILTGDAPSSDGDHPPWEPSRSIHQGIPVNVRNTANASGAILGTLAHGSVVDVVGLAGNGWVLVRQGGLKGWVNGKYLIDHATKPTLARILKLSSPMMRGEDIRWAQARLNALGYPCGDGRRHLWRKDGYRR